jgi:tetratricopeptide (TPR) repeat protein
VALDNEKAYELYLIAQGRFNEGTYIGFTHALESINTALALDPKFALAWVSKGGLHLGLAAGSPAPNLIAPEYDAALQAAQRAIELEPNLAEAYELLGDYRSAKGDWIEAELTFRKATELTSTPLYTIPSAIHLISVGYFKKFHEYIDKARLNDPFNHVIRAFYVVSLGIQGKMHLAKQEDARCKELFGDQWNDKNWAITSIRLGAKDVISSDDVLYSEPIFDAAKEYLDSPEDGLAELRRIYSDQDKLNNYNLVNISTWAAYFGDAEFAMDAQEKAFSICEGRIWTLWYPVMHEVRQTPRFKKFVKKIGLVDYWNKFGWPDICHKLDNGDFVCD